MTSKRSLSTYSNAELRASFVDLVAISDLEYVDNERFIFDGVQDSVVTLSNAIALRTGQPDRSLRPRVLPQRFYAFDDPLPIGFGGDSL